MLRCYLAAACVTAAVGVVAAHEFGHAIQARAGVLDLGLPTVDTGSSGFRQRHAPSLRLLG